MSYLSDLRAAHKERQGRLFTAPKHPVVVNNDPDFKSMNNIIRIVAEHYECNIKLIKSDYRSKHYVLARQTVFYIANWLYGISTVKIARYCGKRTHGTVIKGRNRINRELSFNRNMVSQIRAIRIKLGN